MNQLVKIGRFFYGFGIAAIGIHQLIIADFRSEILPPFPAWPHHYSILPILTGIALVVAGAIISSLFKIDSTRAKDTCLYLAFCFLVLIVTCHLPYILIVKPDEASRLDGWFAVGQALAYCGGAFVMAGSFSVKSFNGGGNKVLLWLEKLVPVGRIFYSLLIILFGFSHFVFTDFVSTMVPKWMGFPLFWTYFVGVALIGSGIAIIFKIWMKPVAFLLAIMLFLFFLFFHVPDAIANPKVGGGNEIVRATIALLFCGVAILIALAEDTKKE